MRGLRYVRTCLLGLSVLSLASCPITPGDPSGDAPADGSLSEVFAYLDQETITYYDIAPPVMPSHAEEISEAQLEEAGFDEAAVVFTTMQQFLASPVDSSTVHNVGQASHRSGSPVQIPRGIPPGQCYPMGSDVYVCIYQWTEGNGVYTAVHQSFSGDLGVPEDPGMWTIGIFFKGECDGVTYPGDVDDANDWGYLVQDHMYAKDAKFGYVRCYMEPGLCDQCDHRPWLEYSFEVEDLGTICTPWDNEELIEYTYSSTQYSCWPAEPDPMYRYHQAIGFVLTVEPDGDTVIENYTYDMASHRYYRCAEWVIDHEDWSISWTFWDSEGGVTGYGKVP